MYIAQRSGLHRVIKSIASPLRFFTLSIIVLGSIVVALSMKAQLPPEMTEKIIYVSFGLMVLLIIIVSIMVIFWPTKLTFDQEAHITVLREQLSDSENPTSYFSSMLVHVDKEGKRALEPLKIDEAEEEVEQ